MQETQTFRELTYTMRPQDPRGDGTGLRFETGEHGGDYPDNMPQATVSRKMGVRCSHTLAALALRGEGSSLAPQGTTAANWLRRTCAAAMFNLGIPGCRMAERASKGGRHAVGSSEFAPSAFV
jgi:hypothetical protein